ncbi:MAG TPA: glycosyltransferase family 4 protein, partial [Planctomycetota bacterium]|nr:glycosyltransferase family 4 protein [Planctomycetota bacterium]
EGVTLHAVPVTGLGRAMQSAVFARSVERMLADETFDVVHGVGKTIGQDVYQPHGGVHLAALEANVRMRGGAAAWFKQLSYALSLKQRVFRRIEHAQYVERPARVFVALSERVKRDMQRFYGVADDRIEVVPNGVDVERFHPRHRERLREPTRQQLRIDADETVFLVVAHNFRLKGVWELVKCVTASKFPPCRLVVVGDGDAEPLVAFASRRTPGRVLFTGAVVDTVPCYAAADAYVHPTWYDPCSLVVLEALASGLPVLTSTMNGASELMTDGREGWIVTPGTRELDAKMRTLFDASLRERMGVAARALAEDHTVGHNVREMTAIYEKVIRLRENA